MYRKPSEKFLFAPAKSFSLNPEESDAEKPPGSPLQEEQLPQPQDTTSTAAARKPKISRTQFSIYQKVALENSFLSSLYLTGQERDALAFKLGLSPATVQTWFKNRRFKWRKEIKKADGSHPEPSMPASQVLLLPSLPTLPYQRSCVGPEQQPLERGSYMCCVSKVPHMRYSSNTHW